jgi:hypothetical protein
VPEDFVIASSALQSLNKFDDDLLDAAIRLSVVKFELGLYGFIRHIIVSLELDLEGALTAELAQTTELGANIYCDTLHEMGPCTYRWMCHVEPAGIFCYRGMGKVT